MNIDHLKLYANEEEFIIGLNEVLNKKGCTIKHAESRKPTEKYPLPAVAILIVDSKGKETPLLIYSSNLDFYKALELIDSKLVFDKEVPKQNHQMIKLIKGKIAKGVTLTEIGQTMSVTGYVYNLKFSDGTTFQSKEYNKGKESDLVGEFLAPYYEALAAKAKEKASRSTFEHCKTLKEAILLWIQSHSEDERKKDYITYRGGKSYSLNDIAKEVEQETKFGKEYEQKVLNLAIELLASGVKELQ